MGNSVSVSFTLDHNLLATIELASFLLLGLGTIAAGCYAGWRGLSSRRGPLGLGQWQRDVMAWDVVGPHEASFTVAEDVARGWSRVQAMTLVGMGGGMVLGVMSAGAIALATTGTLAGTSASGGAPLIGWLFLVALLGVGVGHMLGVAWVRRTTARQVAYADLRPRRLADYRSVVLRWLLLCAIAWQGVMALVAAPLLGARLRIEMLGGLELRIATSPLILAALPLCGLAVVVVGELLLVYVAGLPRLLVTRDPQVAQPADTMLCAQSIGAMQGLVFLALGELGRAQWDLLAGNLPPAAVPWLAETALTLGLIMSMALFLVGLALFMCRGRIGGRLTGWPRRWPRASRELAHASAHANVHR